MLSRDQIEHYEKILMREIAERRNRGGYSPDAATLQFLCETLYEILRHTREKMPMPKKKKKMVEVDDE
jgi:hypothetical protein